MLIDDLREEIKNLDLKTTLVDTPLKHVGKGEFIFANKPIAFRFTPESAGILQTKFKNYTSITYKQLSNAIKEKNYVEFERLANLGFNSLKRKTFTLVHSKYEVINIFSTFVHIELDNFLNLLNAFENRLYRYELNKNTLSLFYHLESTPNYDYPLPLLKVTRSISGRVANSNDCILQINNSDLYIQKYQFQGYYAGYVGRYGLITHANLVKDSFERYDHTIKSTYQKTYHVKTNAIIYEQLLKSFDYELRQGNIKITNILKACKIFERDTNPGNEIINFIAAFNEHGYKAIILRMLKCIFQYF